MKKISAKKPTENKKIFVTINPPNINEIKFFSSTNKNGPGTTPLLIINPINIAAAPDPGIPNARVGIRVPATTELLAVLVLLYLHLHQSQIFLQFLTTFSCV